jgi:tRNA U34 5-methylaminomethyl-2-thiouridine-forming methyltransferase MnmC
MMQQLVVTSDGSHTIFIPELNEHYHSVFGAMQESKHIFIEKGLKYHDRDHFDILEIGFGTGLNALLTALEIIDRQVTVDYSTIEKYPLKDEVVKLLNYGNLTGDEGNAIFKNIHSCKWNEACRITHNMTIKKVMADLSEFSPEESYDIIYFDAFGPDKQPAMWTDEIFSKIGIATRTGGILVTYSAKGQVKRSLRSSGFEVSLLPGPPGKRQMIRAVKK